MNKIKVHWRDLLVVALAVALAWGLRGQHGHERGAAMAGAMAGLSLAAVTGSTRWITAAVIGSLGFAIGGALSYGRFVQPAFQGSWEAIAALVLIGFVWGGLGALGLGLGLALPRYRFWERATIVFGLLLVWLVVDRLLWGTLKGPTDLAARELMALILLVAWTLLSAYVGVWRRDRVSLKLGIAGALGFGVGFPLAAWIQGVGPQTGLTIDWWKVAEHTIGLCGGIPIAWMALRLEKAWRLPSTARPWERWLSLVWLVWFLPSWLIANNLDFWISERAFLPPITSPIVGSLLLMILIGLTVWGWVEINRGRIFVTPWMPAQLRWFFILFLWTTTLIACSKTLVIDWRDHVPIIFVVFATIITLGVFKKRVH